MGETKLISIIAPLYNEELNILIFYEQLMKVLFNIKDRYDYELIFINDGSYDRSGEIIGELSQKDPKIKHLEFTRNFGKEVATSAGLNYAGGQAAILIDVDLQHPVELIPEFIKKWEEGYGVVIGVRKHNHQYGMIKKLGSIGFYQILNLIGETRLTPGGTDFRLLDRQVINEFNRLPEKNRLVRGLISWLGFKRCFIDFTAQARNGGRAGYTHMKLVRLAVSSFVAYSLVPLKLASYFGVFITLVASGLGVFMIIDKYLLNDLFHFSFSGTAILATLNLFLTGIMLICLGLIALYVANIHDQVINRPLYIIRKKNF